MIAGKPLLAYSIEQALASQWVDRTIVSTDSPAYAKIARGYGAETPFLRPAEISGDLSTDLEAFTHALTWLAENESYAPDICVHLRPTYPEREVADIDNAIQLLLDNPEADSVRSIAPAEETPYKMWLRDARGWLAPVAQTDIPEAHSHPRQELPLVFMQNACVDVIRTRTILELHSMTGRHILGYLMANSADIDTVSQFDAAARRMVFDTAAQEKPIDLSGRKTFCFDIDGVIASQAPISQYDTAKPLIDNVRLVNRLHEMGHEIVLFTARGFMTGIDWKETTERQMAEWGVQYDRLLFGKPAADYYIDDRFVDIERVRRSIREFEGAL